MPSYRIAAALFISAVLSFSAIAQTKTAGPGQAQPLPSRPLSSSAGDVSSIKAAQAPANISPNGMSLPQAVRPATSQVQANTPAAASPTPAQSASAPTSPQVQVVPQTASGTISVDYRNGLLSVVADKAELGKVLQLVGAKLGTSIEVAPEVTAEPVVAHIKAAPPAQVLAQLLDGPQLEYIVIGADETGHALNRVVVRRRNSFARQPLVAIKAPTETAGAAK
jgi:hypothetical protein